MEKTHKLLSREVEREVAKRPPDAMFNKIRDIHTKAGEWETIYAGRKLTSYCIGLDDIYKIIECEQLCNSVINAHSHLLKEELDSDVTHAFKIFYSLVWTYIRNESLDVPRKQKIDKVLTEHELNNYKRLLFPMNSNMDRELTCVPNHWTLLVLDVKDKKWMFYNSNLPRGGNRKDPYIADALVVRKNIEDKMDALSSVPSFKIQSQSEYQFEAVKNCPQQGDIVDCVLFVCHNIETIARDLPVPYNVTEEEMAEFKLQMIGRFLMIYDERIKQAEVEKRN